jgi:hypothetical protein
MNPRPYHLSTEGALDAGTNELYVFIVQSNSSGLCNQLQIPSFHYHFGGILIITRL